jgi:hypothetical protein
MTAAYSHKFIRVTFSGTMFSGAEDWSTGLQLGWEDADIELVAPGIAEQLAGYWITFFQHGSVGVSNQYRATEVKCALILPNGKTDVENIDYYNISGGAAGGYTSAPLPPQITLAATMTTELQRGLASKGRMYLPGISWTVNSGTGRLDSSTTNAIGTQFKTLLDAYNADPDIPGSVIVASKGHKTTALDSDNHPVYENGRNSFVTGLRIGDVYDTQRRRRNNLAEQYNTKVLQ